MISLILPALLYSAKRSVWGVLNSSRGNAKEYILATLWGHLWKGGSLLSVIINQVTKNLGFQLPGMIIFYALWVWVILTLSWGVDLTSCNAELSSLGLRSENLPWGLINGTLLRLMLSAVRHLCWVLACWQYVTLESERSQEVAIGKHRPFGPNDTWNSPECSMRGWTAQSDRVILSSSTLGRLYHTVRVSQGYMR